MNKKIAVLLCGCGHQDGSEITEVVSSLIALNELSLEYQCFSPDISFTVENHLNQSIGSEKRNTLIEAARISRGNVKNYHDLDVEEFDGLVIPGGTGLAKNLSTWPSEGAMCQVDSHLAQIIQKFHAGSRPILAICIAPALVCKALESHGISSTLGLDAGALEELTATGAEAVACPSNDFVTDRLNKIISTPAYMNVTTPFEVFSGIRAAMKEFGEMA